MLRFLTAPVLCLSRQDRACFSYYVIRTGLALAKELEFLAKSYAETGLDLEMFAKKANTNQTDRNSELSLG